VTCTSRFPTNLVFRAALVEKRGEVERVANGFHKYGRHLNRGGTWVRAAQQQEEQEEQEEPEPTDSARDFHRREDSLPHEVVVEPKVRLASVVRDAVELRVHLGRRVGAQAFSGA